MSSKAVKDILNPKLKSNTMLSKAKPEYIIKCFTETRHLWNYSWVLTKYFCISTDIITCCFLPSSQAAENQRGEYFTYIWMMEWPFHNRSLWNQSLIKHIHKLGSHCTTLLRSSQVTLYSLEMIAGNLHCVLIWGNRAELLERLDKLLDMVDVSVHSESLTATPQIPKKLNLAKVIHFRLNVL